MRFDKIVLVIQRNWIFGIQFLYQLRDFIGTALSLINK
jgi:hypothetical protein